MSCCYVAPAWSTGKGIDVQILVPRNLEGEGRGHRSYICSIPSIARLFVSYRREVLVLQFNLERRDRRRREYVLLEDGDHENIMEVLAPVVQQNQSTLSMGNKLEVREKFRKSNSFLFSILSCAAFYSAVSPVPKGV